MDSAEKLNTPTPEGHPEHIDVIETLEGKFRLIYGRHDVEQPTSDLGENVGGVVLEWGSMELSDIHDIPTKQYSALLGRIREESLPVYVTDINDSGYGSVISFLAELGVRGLSVAALWALWKKRGTLNRRTLLKLGASVAVAYGPIATATDYIAIHTQDQSIKRAAYNVAEHTQIMAPYVLTLRNIVLAHKMARVASRDRDILQGKELAGVYGAAHFKITELLHLSHEERLERFRGALRIIPRSFNTAQDFALLIRLDPKPVTTSMYQRIADPEATAGWGVSVDFDEDLLLIAREEGFPDA